MVIAGGPNKFCGTGESRASPGSPEKTGASPQAVAAGPVREAGVGGPRTTANAHGHLVGGQAPNTVPALGNYTRHLYLPNSLLENTSVTGWDSDLGPVWHGCGLISWAGCQGGGSGTPQWGRVEELHLQSGAPTEIEKANSEECHHPPFGR